MLGDERFAPESSFRKKPWVRVVSAVMAVLLAATMFDASSLSPVVRDARADTTVETVELPMGERALVKASPEEVADDDSEGQVLQAVQPEDEGNEFWQEVQQILTAEGARLLAPADLVSSEDVLPSVTDEFSDPDDVASRVMPSLVAFGVPLNPSSGYKVKDGSLRARYDLGNLSQTLEGGFVGGSSEQDSFVLTLDVPYLFSSGNDDSVAATLSEEEWRLHSALEIERESSIDDSDSAEAIADRVIARARTMEMTAPRAALFSDRLLDQWSVWQEHDGSYRRLGDEDLKAGVSGHLVLRYEGVEGDRRLSANASSPEFTLGFTGAVPEGATAAIRFGYEYQSYTPPTSDASGSDDRETSHAKVLRSAIGSISLSNTSAESAVTMEARAIGEPKMPVQDGRGRGWSASVVAFTVPTDAPGVTSFMFTGQWAPDWRGRGGVALADLAAYRVTKEGEGAEESYRANTDEYGAVLTDADTLSSSEFVGVPGMGGAVVLDVTGRNDEEIGAIDPADSSSLNDNGLAPLPYRIALDGTISVQLEKGEGAIEPSSTRKLYVAVPYSESALVEAADATSDGEDDLPVYEEVRASFRMQAMTQEKTENLIVANVADVTSRFTAVLSLEPSQTEEGQSSAKEPSYGQDDIESDGEDENASANVLGKVPSSTGEEGPDVGSSPVRIMARLLSGAPLYAAAFSNVSPDTVINPHPLLLSENEMVPSADSDLVYLIKSSDLTRISLNMTFGWQQGHVGNVLQKTSFTVTVPYLYRDGGTGAVLSAYTREDIQKALEENGAEPNSYNDMRLVIQPDSSIFNEWDIVDDQKRRITKTTYPIYYPQGLTGTFTLSYRGSNGLGQMGMNFKRPEFQVYFIGNIPENTGATIKVGGDNYIYSDGSTDYGCRKSVEPGDRSDGAAQSRTITFIKTNLEWNTTVENKWSPAMWDKYNYMVYRVVTTNTSADTETTIDDLGYTFRMTGNGMGGGGMRVEDLMTWDADGNLVPRSKQRADAVDDNGKPLQLIGKPNEGGALIYDVTAVDDVIWDNLDLDKFSNVDYFLEQKDAEGNPLVRQISYQTGGQEAQVTFVVDREDGGSLVPKTDETPNASNRRVILLALPYTNNFTPFTMNGVKVYPNVALDTNSVAYFGNKASYSEDYSWSKTLSNSDSFKEAKNDFTYTKTAYNRLTDQYLDGRYDARDRLGYISKFRIQNIETLGNMPVTGDDLTLAYGATINDMLPVNYELAYIDFRLKREKGVVENADGTTTPLYNKLEDFVFLEGNDAEGNPYVGNGVQFEVKAGLGAGAPTSWITLDAKPALMGPELDAAGRETGYDIYRVGGAASGAGIAALLEERNIQAMPRNTLVTNKNPFRLTGHIRFLMASELPTAEGLPLDITINGIMRSPLSDGDDGRYTNRITSHFGRKQWVVPIGADQGGYYSTVKYTGGISEAHLMPETPVSPQVDANPYDRRSDGAITWGPTDGEVGAPLSQTRSGFTFHLSNANTSRIEPGVFSTDELAYKDRRYNPNEEMYEYRGVETKYIVLSKGLLDRSNIVSLTINYKDPNYGKIGEVSYPENASMTLTKQELLDPDNGFVMTDDGVYGVNVPAGSVVIPQSVLRNAKGDAGHPYVRSLSLKFDTFDGEVSVPASGEGAFISLLGYTSFTGKYTLQGTFETTYEYITRLTGDKDPDGNLKTENGTLVQLSDTSSATLNVNPAKPLVYAYGFKGAWGADRAFGELNTAYRSALGQPNSGFSFYVGNDSPTALQPGSFSTSAMPFERFGATSDQAGARRGFETSCVELSPEFLMMTNRPGHAAPLGTVTAVTIKALDAHDEELSYTYSIERDAAGNVMSDTLTPLLALDGSLVLSPKQWDGNYFSTVEIFFDYFDGEKPPLDSPRKDAASGSYPGAFVNIYGTTTWLARELRVVGTLASEYNDPESEVLSTGVDLEGKPLPGAPCAAVLAPTNGTPTVEAFGFDTGAATVSSDSGGSHEAPLFADRTGYLFRLGNDSESLLQPGVFSTSDIPVHQVDVTDEDGSAVVENRGFQTTSVVISGHALEVMDIEEVRLFALNLGDPVVISGDDLKRYIVQAGSHEATEYGAGAVGSAVLPSSLWGDAYFQHVEITYDRFDGNVRGTGAPKDSDAYVAIHGTVTEMGSPAVTGTLATRHGGYQAAESSKDRTASQKATLVGSTIKPAVSITAGWSLDGVAYTSGIMENYDVRSNNGDYPRVPLSRVPYRWGEDPAHEKAWFRYVLTNDSDSAGVNVYYQLEVDEAASDNAATAPFLDRQGFAPRELSIAGFVRSSDDDSGTPGAWHHVSGDLAGIDIIESDGVTRHRYSMDDLARYIDSSNTLNLPLHGKDVNGNPIGSVKSVRIRYDLLKEHATGANRLEAYLYGRMETHGAYIANMPGYWTGTGSYRVWHEPDPMHQYRYTRGNCTFGPLDSRYDRADGTNDITRTYLIRNYIDYFDWSVGATAYKAADQRPVDGMTTGADLRVAHYADGVGYNLTVRNGTQSRSDINRVTFAVPWTENKLDGSAPAPGIFGFKTKTFTLSADLFDFGLERHERDKQKSLISLTFSFVSPVTGMTDSGASKASTVTFTRDELLQNIATYQADPASPLVFNVTAGAFADQAGKYLRSVTVEYGTVDPAYVGKALTAQFRGKTDWWNNFDDSAHIPGTVTAQQTGVIPSSPADYPERYGQDRKTATAYLNTPRPYLNIAVHEKYNEITTGTFEKPGNQDGLSDTMAVPYDRDFKVWAELSNSDAYSYIDSADVSLNVFLQRESNIVTNEAYGTTTAWTGFHTTKATISASYLGQWEKPGKIRLYPAVKPPLTYSRTSPRC